jgi:ATP-grasp domain, R2K clade family 3
LLGCYDYWEEGEYSADKHPSLDIFKGIAKNIESNFFSMDIAKTKNGEWIIIELGDGQVAGLPAKVDRLQFYDLARRYYGS